MDIQAPSSICEFNAQRDTNLAHFAPGFETVLHIFDAHWHGIRSATGCCPGHKLAISHETGLDGEAYRHIYGIISKYGITHIVYQGFSWVGHELALNLKKEFGEAINIFVVTHVTSAQFENHFEMQMQSALIDGKKRGLFAGLGSVKPHFDSVVPDYFSEVIVNYAPNVAPNSRPFAVDTSAIFVPIENSWRKNLYSNLIAAAPLDEVENIYAVNWPTGLDQMFDLSKLRLTSYKKGMDLFSFMGAVGALLNVTLAECQPMTQLEALAMGTPCLTGPLRMDDFANDPLCALTESEILDNPYYIRKALKELLNMRQNHTEELAGMIDDHLTRRHAIATQRYADFLQF